jgi:hypothetical protein
MGVGGLVEGVHVLLGMSHKPNLRAIGSRSRSSSWLDQGSSSCPMRTLLPDGSRKAQSMTP